MRTCLSSSAFFSRTRRRSIASSRRCETAAVVRNTDGSNFSYSWNCVAQHGLPVGTIPSTTQTVDSSHLDSPGAGERVHALKAMHVMVFVRCAPLGQLVQPLTHQVRGATPDRLAHTPSPLARLPAPMRCGRQSRTRWVWQGSCGTAQHRLVSNTAHTDTRRRWRRTLASTPPAQAAA